jgi:hypothetical protein
MVKYLLLIVVGLALAVSPAQAWFSQPENWNAVYIAKVNDFDCTPTASNTAPDGGTVSLPATFYVKTSPTVNGSPVTVKLQYRNGSGVWVDLAPSYTSTAHGVKTFAVTHTAFWDALTTAHYTKGAACRVRIYVSDGVVQNASTALDTTEDGTNGWQDQWVVGFTAAAGNLKPAAPGN